MKLITAGLLSAILIAGLAGSVAAYRSQTGQDVSVEQPSARQSPLSLTADIPRPRIRWAPCDEGSRLEKGICVTDVLRTVVVPAPPAPVVPAPATPRAAPRRYGDGDGSGDAVDRDSGDDDRHAEEDHGEDEDD